MAFGALTCLVAVLTATTFAQAVDQTSKNGCTSPQPYSGSLTSPTFTAAGDVEFGAAVTFNAWFEIESVAPGAFDRMTPSSGDDGGNIWNEIGELVSQSTPPQPGGADIPYSNLGTGARPGFQGYNFNLPISTNNQPVQVRIMFNTGDSTYQGFRGLGIDDLSLSTTLGTVTQNFDGGVPSGLDPRRPERPRRSVWQVLTNPQNVKIKSPEISPNLVTLGGADDGTLPTAASGNGIAGSGNTATGTFCGPDFASTDQAPDTIITDGPPDSTASKDATFSFTASEPASFFQCTLDGNATA